MTSWGQLEKEAPDLARRTRERLHAHRHKILATLRKDGSPRISGIEASFADGELWLGGMWRSLKFLDLMRDPRLALHCAPVDPELTTAPGDLIDVKLAGTAVLITDVDEMAKFAKGASPDSMHMAKVDVSEVVSIMIGDPADHLVIDSWNETRGLRSVKRY